MSSTTKTWTLRGRRAVLVLVLLACSASLASAQPAQSDSLEVRFSPTAGTFVGSETVTLSVQGSSSQGSASQSSASQSSASQSSASIHYTLDGSLPTVTSPIYREPLTLDTSTRLRAVAISPTRGSSGATADAGLQGPVATETYLRVDPDTQHFTSHLPIILIHTFESAALDAYGTEHVPAALLIMEPTSGTSRLVGRAALDARIGIHVRGQTSRLFPKKQYALELRADDDDSDSDRPLLGLPSHSEWVLSDPVVYDRALIRNALAFDLSNRIGRYAPRTRFAEAFVVDAGGDVRAANFAGFYTLIEKIERDPQRVNVGRLPRSAAGAPEFSGGFILRIDKGVPDFAAAGRWLQFVYPNADDMLVPERKSQFDFIRTFIDSFGQAVSAADFRHPSTGQHYSAFIDVDAWIDHHLINVLTKNVDGLRFSAYFHKERDSLPRAESRGLLVAGPVWDFDRSLGTPYDLRATEPEEWQPPTFNTTDYFNEGWWGYLFRDPDFVSRYRARFKALLNEPFSPDTLDLIVDGMASQVGDAADRNFRRWIQSPPRDNSHAAEITLLKDFLRRRVAWIKIQLDTTF